MTRDEILNMPAGQDLDVEIAVRIFGYELLPPPAQPALQKPTDHGVEVLYFVNHYSTDIKAAWDVMEELNKVVDHAHNHERYFRYARFHDWMSDNVTLWALSSKEAALVICRAALLAAMEVQQT